MKNKYYGSTLEWRDYEFFVCDDEKQEEAITLLTEREFLLESKTPNEDKLRTDAQAFANKLAERFVRSDRAKHFGLEKYAANIEKFNQMQDKSHMYYYMAYLYGSVFWRVPYNVQRLPVVTDALEIYLDTFAETLAACLNDYADSEMEETEAEMEAQNETD